MITVGVLGAKGRMGAEVCRAVQADPDLELAAAIDAGEPRDALAGAQVAVDFTRPDAVMDNIAWCVEHGVNVVVGTTGFTEDRYDQVRSLVDGHPGVGVLVAPNFSIGAVLMMAFARIAAAHMTSAEIIELHHANKVDAPSGTSVATAQGMAVSRASAGMGDMPDATAQSLPGARGAEVDGVHVHSVRLTGLVAHQEVLFGSLGETLTIRHDSFDRVSFMPGVLTAVKAVVDLPGLTIGIDKLLGIG